MRAQSLCPPTPAPHVLRALPCSLCFPLQIHLALLQCEWHRGCLGPMGRTTAESVAYHTSLTGPQNFNLFFPLQRPLGTGWVSTLHPFKGNLKMLPGWVLSTHPWGFLLYPDVPIPHQQAAVHPQDHAMSLGLATPPSIPGIWFWRATLSKCLISLKIVFQEEGPFFAMV